MSGWIQSNNLFTVPTFSDKQLKSLASGVITDDSSGVNCDKVKAIDQAIEESLYDLDLEQRKIKC